MGHLAAKDVYRELGGQIDGLSCRAPFNETLRAILQALYSEEEARFVSQMPSGLADLAAVAAATGLEPKRLPAMLEGLCARGLVLDLWVGEEYLYAPSPFIIGIFEFTMMRTRGKLDIKAWAELFHKYLDEGEFWEANSGHGEQVSILRSLPREEALPWGGHVEILDHEKASSCIEEATRFAVGLCACRHAREHLGGRTCQVPLETCTAFGFAADYLIRHGLAREISKAEMKDLFAASRDRRLALCADNVQRRISYVCHCCKCCCTALAGITKHGYANVVVTSGFVAKTEAAACTGCGACVRTCPVDAISLSDQKPRVDEVSCLGCGVCVLGCASKCLSLKRRAQRVIPPEDFFAKVILQNLEKGNLARQLFSDPQRATHRFLRGFVGGVLRLDRVKRAIVTGHLRSVFLETMRWGARRQGRGALTEL